MLQPCNILIKIRLEAVNKVKLLRQKGGGLRLP